MALVSIVTAHDDWPWLRQTPGGQGRWNNTTFDLGYRPDADWIVVVDEPASPLRLDLPKERLIGILPEPPELKSYGAAYCEQFGTIITPVPRPGNGPRMIRSQTAVPWFFGVEYDETGWFRTHYDYEALAEMAPPDKSPKISVVCSTKSRLPKHQARLNFIARLNREFGEQVDVFGRGFRPVGDKADAIAPYQYHLVLENTDHDHLWTEKLADAYLGFALPLFSGCTNVTDYFPAESLIPVDIADPDSALAAIRQAIDADLFHRRLPAVVEARERLLREHNFFALVDAVIAGHCTGTVGRVDPWIVWPVGQQGWVNQARTRLKRHLRTVRRTAREIVKGR